MRRLWLLPLLLLAACSTPAAADPVNVRISHYNSGNFGERTARLTLGHYPDPAPKYVVYCIDLGTTPVGGEILSIQADMEVTNNLGYNVSIVTHPLLLESCSQVDGGEIAEANGENAIPAVHHEVAVRVGSLKVETGNSRRYVGLVAWASSTAAQPGHYVQVMQDYGRLSVIRYTPS